MKSATRVDPLGERRDWNFRQPHSVAVQRPEATSEPATRPAHRARHGGQRQRHPRCLLSVVGALHRIGRRDHGALGGDPVAQLFDGVGRQSGDARGPVRVLRHTVAATHQVVLERCPAHGAVGQEIEVVQSRRDDGVGQTEHHRYVGSRPGRQPGAVQELRRVRPQRGDREEIDAGRSGPLLRARRRMRAQAAVIDLAVTQGQSTEGDHQRAVFGDLVEGRRRVHRGLPTAPHSSQQHRDRRG